MKKGSIYTGYVERVDFPNKGRVRISWENEDGSPEEAVCMVKNVLPGQTVQVRITKKKHGEAEGMCLSVEKPADNEIASPCPHFGICGGCSYQNIAYEDQLALKERQVVKLLSPVLGEGFEKTEIYKGIKGSPKKYGYKNKMEFSFGDSCKGGELTLGLHKKGSFYDIVDVSSCQIVCEDIRKILKCVITECKRQNLGYYHKNTHEGLLRHLLVRRAEKTGEILLDLVTTSQCEFDMEAIREALLALPLEGSFAGILHSVNDSLADVVVADRTDILYGHDYFYEEILGLKFKVSTFSFFQTNSLGAEVLYDTARDFIFESMGIEKGHEKDQSKLPVIYDLYSGTGTIAQLLAPAASQVIGVEIVEEAVEAAKDNAALNGLTNCTFLAGDVLKTLDSIDKMPDFIVLDPPRDGIHPKALPKLINYNVDNMIYISCKPTSLSRDLPSFLEAGYEVKKVAMVDMFPGTVHVETVVLMSKVK